MNKLTAMILEPEPPTQVRNALLNTEQFVIKTAWPSLMTPSAQMEYFNRLGAYCVQQIAAFESSQGSVRQGAAGAHVSG
jgi:hypothetical protein